MQNEKDNNTISILPIKYSQMKNTQSKFYSILIILFIILYLYFDFSMNNSRGGTGLGAYLIYIGITVIHSIILFIRAIVNQLQNKANNNFVFYLNVILVLFIFLRLFIFVS